MHDSPPQNMTTAQIHANDSVLSFAVTLDVFLLFTPEEPRWANVQDRRTGKEERVPVLSLLFCDQHGLISMELWRNAVETFRQATAAHDFDVDCMPRLRITFAKVIKERSPCFPSMKKLTAQASTQFQLLTLAATSTLCLPTAFSPSMHIRDFQMFSSCLPACINLAGVVGEVLPENSSRDGTSMQGFTLHDSAGNVVSCMAYGRHAGSPYLKAGSELVCFFGKGVAGLGSNPGQVWLHDDSHLVRLRVGAPLVPKRQEITMRA